MRPAPKREPRPEEQRLWPRDKKRPAPAAATTAPSAKTPQRR